MRTGKPARFTALALSLASTLLVFGCRAQQPPPAIVIGVVLYTDEEATNRSVLNGIQMAIEALSADGGPIIGGVRRRVELVTESVPSAAPEASMKAVVRLINQRGAAAILGPQFSVDAVPAGQAAEDAHVPLIAPISTNPRTTAGRRYVFRMGFLDEVQGSALASFARETLRIKRAAVLFNISEPYSREVASVFRRAFEGLGGQVAAWEPYTSDLKDYTPALGRIRDARPEALVLTALTKEAVLQAVQARRMGIREPLLGGDGWNRASVLPMPEFEGSYAVYHWAGATQNEPSRLFSEQYLRRHGVLPTDLAALTYDGLCMVLKAAELRGAATPEAIKDGLYGLPPFAGLTGEIDFVDSGDPVKAPVVLHFVGGRAEPFRSAPAP